MSLSKIQISFAFSGAAVLFVLATEGEARKPDPPVPDRFVIARDSYFDFGPPLDYYDFFSVRPNPTGGTIIDHVELTPSVDACTRPPTLKVHDQLQGPSVRELLAGSNPCAIADKQLTRELRRCKHCLNFSGAVVVMQVPCGGKMREIPISMLTDDLFGEHPHAPSHTSWTMRLLERLDGPDGAPAMNTPAFPGLLPPPQANESSSNRRDENPLATDLEAGKLDALLSSRDKPSELFRAIRNPPPPPTVELIGSDPVKPASYKLPPYPPLALLAHVNGRISLSITIQSDGRPSAPRFSSEKRLRLLEPAVTTALADWRFPPEHAGEEVNVEMEFAMSCPANPAK